MKELITTKYNKTVETLISVGLSKFDAGMIATLDQTVEEHSPNEEEEYKKWRKWMIKRCIKTEASEIIPWSFITGVTKTVLVITTVWILYMLLF